MRALRSRKLFSKAGKTVKRRAATIYRIERQRQRGATEKRRVGFDRHSSSVSADEQFRRAAQNTHRDGRASEFDNENGENENYRSGGTSLFLRRADQKRNDVFAARQKRRTLLAAGGTSSIAAAGEIDCRAVDSAPADVFKREILRAIELRQLFQFLAVFTKKRNR